MVKREKVIEISANMALCIAVIVFFGRNSLLRPAACQSIYKEYLSGMLVLLMAYANSLFLIPRLFLKRRFTSFSLAAFASISFAGILEFALVHEEMSAMVFRYSQGTQYHLEMLTYLFLICIRDFAFWCFFFMSVLLKVKIREVRILDRAISKQSNLISVKTFKNEMHILPIDQIAFVEAQHNIVIIHTLDGSKYYRYCSLKEMSHTLGVERAVRISRSHLVMKSAVATCDREVVTLRSTIETEPVTLVISDSFQNEALSALATNEVIPRQQTTRDSTAKVRTDIVLEYIKEHPGCKMTVLITDMNLKRSTIEKEMSRLKNMGLVEYRGSKKTGGYYLKDFMD